MGRKKSLLCPITLLLPKDIFTVDNLTQVLQGASQAPLVTFEPDVALTSPLRPNMATDSVKLLSHFTAGQHAALVPGVRGLAPKQRPNCRWIESVLQPVIDSVSHVLRLDPQSEHVQAARRMLMVEGAALLEVRCVARVPSMHARLLIFVAC